MLLKNKRFKLGSRVDLHYSPIFSRNTISISTNFLAGTFQITATFDVDLTPEMIEVGDIASFAFGAGEISSVNQYSVIVDFPDSTFPDTIKMREYTGSDYQHVYIFKGNERKISSLLVESIDETIKEAVYGISDTQYNQELSTELSLVKTKVEEDGSFYQILSSPALVVKACDTSNYNIPRTSWVGDFPIQLGGNTIDPIYRLAKIKERSMTTKRGSIWMSFKLKIYG